MPTYDYECPECSHGFEALVRGDETPACPQCGNAEPERLLSLPRVRTSGTRQKALNAAKERDKRQGAERTRERIEYEASHD